tara:strand:- start:151 stop:885 length:735 start_codon:yes stop_codon:yes gene_type:complete
MKNLVKYLSDFLMVFLAISLGFLADNFRENYSIKRDLNKNFESLINDLKQDSINMSIILSRDESKSFQSLVKLNDLLYRYHKENIGWKKMKKEIKTLEPLPAYGTLFMDNSTFKNMQSSGLLSSIDDEDLKNDLSYYYEVMLKRLSDNNSNFDRIGIEFYNKNFPFVSLSFFGRFVFGESIAKKPDDYLDVQLDLETSKKIITSEKLMFDLDAYTGEYLFYKSIIRDLMGKNQNLLDKLYLIDK